MPAQVRQAPPRQGGNGTTRNSVAAPPKAPVVKPPVRTGQTAPSPSGGPRSGVGQPGGNQPSVKQSPANPPVKPPSVKQPGTGGQAAAGPSRAPVRGSGPSVKAPGPSKGSLVPASSVKAPGSTKGSLVPGGSTTRNNVPRANGSVRSPFIRNRATDPSTTGSGGPTKQPPVKASDPGPSRSNQPSNIKQPPVRTNGNIPLASTRSPLKTGGLGSSQPPIRNASGQPGVTGDPGAPLGTGAQPVGVGGGFVAGQIKGANAAVGVSVGFGGTWAGSCWNSCWEPCSTWWNGCFSNRGWSSCWPSWCGWHSCWSWGWCGWGWNWWWGWDCWPRYRYWDTCWSYWQRYWYGYWGAPVATYVASDWVVADSIPLQTYRAMNNAELGDLYLRSGDAKAAISAYQMHLEEHPSDSLARRALGLALLSDGRAAEAAESIAAAYATDPGLADRPFTTGAFASAEEFRTNLELASAYANRVKDAPAWLMVAALLQADGNAVQAEMMLDRAVNAGLVQEISVPLRRALRG